jgi:hypothetical protein
MLLNFGRICSRSSRRFSSSAATPRSPIRGIIFDAGGVLFSSPMQGLAAALQGSSPSTSAAVTQMFGAAAYRFISRAEPHFPGFLTVTQRHVSLGPLGTRRNQPETI